MTNLAAPGRIGPWVVAHRGSSGTAPENTLAAFRRAALEGADAIELDVQATADGELVAIHDLTLDRTTTGQGEVAGHTLAQLKALDAGSWKAPQFAGEPIPTLREVCRLARDAGLGLVAEAKTTWMLNPTLARQMVAVLEDERCLDRTLLIAFEHRLLSDLARIRSDVRMAPLVDGGLDTIDPLLEATMAWAYAPSYEFVMADRVAQVHDKGRRVCVWTVDDPDHMARLIDAGVDGLTTNHPTRLVELMRRRGLQRRPWMDAQVPIR